MKAARSVGGELAYEPSDASPRLVAYSVLALLAGIVISGVIVAGVLWLVTPSPPAIVPLSPLAAQLPPPPRLETSPEADRLQIEAKAQAMLGGYAWVDNAKGRVRVPIERAMKLLEEQGWPDAQGGGAQ
jgi:hypothetical protein